MSQYLAPSNASSTYDTWVPAGTIVSASGNGPTLGGYEAARYAVVQINVTAVAGVSPNLTVNLQDSVDGQNWMTVGSSSGITATGTYSIRVPVTTAFTGTLRLTYTVTGTTPSFTMGVSAWMAKSG